MRNLRNAFAVGVVLAVASTTIVAADSAWTLRFHGAIVDSSASTGVDVSGSGVTTGVDVGGGFGLGAEYRLSNRLGLELSTLFAGLEVGTTVSRGNVESYQLSMVPVTLGLPIHFKPGRVDLFVAPTFSVVNYLDIETTASIGNVGSSVENGADPALGVAFGLDIPFGKGNWAFSSGLRYMKTGTNGTSVDPTIVMVGFAYRF